MLTCPQRDRWAVCVFRCYVNVCFLTAFLACSFVLVLLSFWFCVCGFLLAFVFALMLSVASGPRVPFGVFLVCVAFACCFALCLALMFTAALARVSFLACVLVLRWFLLLCFVAVFCLDAYRGLAPE